MIRHKKHSLTNWQTSLQTWITCSLPVCLCVAGSYRPPLKETCLLLTVWGLLNCAVDDDDDDNTVLSAFKSSSALDCSPPAALEVLTAFRTVCIDNGLFFGALKVGRLSGSPLPIFEACLVGVLLLMLLLLGVWVPVEASPV